MKKWMATFYLIVTNSGFGLNLFFLPIWNSEGIDKSEFI